VMQFVKFVSLPAAALVMTVAASSSAQAQPAVNLSAGYQVAYFSQSSAETKLYGWYVDVADTVRPMVAVVGEVGGVYSSLLAVSANQYSYQGGIRWFSTASPAVTPFGQVLVGGTTAGGGGSSISAFSTQLGGGVNVRMVDAVALRFGVDYRRVFFPAANGGGENQVRVLAGVAVDLGK
jgi:hypothetical protein